MSKSFALLFVLVFLAASCLVVAKPAFSSHGATGNSWTPKAPMQVARGGLGVAVVNGKIYAIGGSTQTGSWLEGFSGGVVGTNEEYDSATDRWTFKKPMPTPRKDFGTAVWQNKIYCIGGYNGKGDNIGANEVYDPATDTWVTKSSMPTARSGLQANTLDGKIYLTGGLPNRTLNEVYDPATDSWETKAHMPVEEVIMLQQLWTIRYTSWADIILLNKFKYTTPKLMNGVLVHLLPRLSLMEQQAQPLARGLQSGYT